MKKITTIYLILMMSLLTSCSREHRKFDNTKLDLTINYFKELGKINTLLKQQNNKTTSTQLSETLAARSSVLTDIIRKISILDNAEYSIAIANVQESNAAMAGIQHQINTGDIHGAMQSSRDAVKKYPHNLQLLRVRNIMPQLLHADSLLNALTLASNASQMRSAYANALNGLSRNRTSELNELLNAYEKKIELVSQQEKLNTTLAEQKTSELLKDSRQHDIERRKEDEEVNRKITEKTADGIRAHENAGEVRPVKEQ